MLAIHELDGLIKKKGIKAVKYPALIIIISVICRTLAIIAVLAFVFLLVYISGRYSFLWFLFLILACKYVPVYKYTSTDETREGNETQEGKEKHQK